MASEPQVFDNSLKLDSVLHKRKRRFKIFDSKPKETEQPQQQRESEQQPEQPQQRRQLALTRPVQMVKIEPKSLQLEREMEGSLRLEEEDGEIELLEVQLGYETVYSRKFIASDGFRQLPTPSVLFRGDQAVINEEGELFQSVQQVHLAHSGLAEQVGQLTASLSDLTSSVTFSETNAQAHQRTLDELSRFLEGVEEERRACDRKVSDIDRRITLMQTLRKRQEFEKEQVELRVLEAEQGECMEVEEQQAGRMAASVEEDEFVESHYLPVEFINKYLEDRRATQPGPAHTQPPKEEACSPNVQLFHPIFRIGNKEYRRLLQFLLQELPALTAESLRLRLVFRRGTTDLEAESVGEKDELEYKPGLLFVVKTSTGKRIGGFISNCLVQGETMEDARAFLFTLEEGGVKLPIREECAGAAFAASRHYLVTFSSDLMIASNCLEEESFCEWPSSYAGHLACDNAWLAGDYEFMIEHIEVFEVVGPE